MSYSDDHQKPFFLRFKSRNTAQFYNKSQECTTLVWEKIKNRKLCLYILLSERPPLKTITHQRSTEGRQVELIIDGNQLKNHKLFEEKYVLGHGP